jgi:hypothetical protein
MTVANAEEERSRYRTQSAQGQLVLKYFIDGGNDMPKIGAGANRSCDDECPHAVSRAGAPQQQQTRAEQGDDCGAGIGLSL